MDIVSFFFCTSRFWRFGSERLECGGNDREIHPNRVPQGPSKDNTWPSPAASYGLPAVATNRMQGASITADGIGTGGGGEYVPSTPRGAIL